MTRSIPLVILSLIFFTSLPSYAYIGPGMSGGVIAITLGFIAAIFLALFGILYYPIKRALKSRREKKMASQKLSGKN